MKRDVYDYVCAMKKQMDEVQTVADKLNKEITEGEVSAEMYAQFASYYEIVKSNYDRASYILYLLNLPPKWVQKLRERRLAKKNEKRVKEFEAASLEAVQTENDEAIKRATELYDSEFGDFEC